MEAPEIRCRFVTSIKWGGISAHDLSNRADDDAEVVSLFGSRWMTMSCSSWLSLHNGNHRGAGNWHQNGDDGEMAEQCDCGLAGWAGTWRFAWRFAGAGLRTEAAVRC